MLQPIELWNTSMNPECTLTQQRLNRMITLFRHRYLEGLNASTERYEKWFGVYTEARKDIVKSHFELMGDKPQNMTYVYNDLAKVLGYLWYAQTNPQE